MTLFAAKRIEELTADTLAKARKLLAALPVACGCEPQIAGLHGWAFEQVILHCLRQELKAIGLQPEFRQQVPFGGRARADFSVGHILVEVKTAGLFDMGSVERYSRYRNLAVDKGHRYMFISAHETYKPYRDGILTALGQENVFMLDEPAGWNNFVATVAEELRGKNRPTTKVRQTSGGSSCG